MQRLQMAMKLLGWSISLFVAFGGHYPPAYPQQHDAAPHRQIVPVVTVEDAVQDNRIDQIETHLDATDARLQRMIEAVNKNANDIAGIQGEERIIGGVLALLSSAGIFIQLRRKAV